VALAFIVLPHSIAAATTREVRRILLLTEAGLTYPAIARISQGIQSALENSPYHLEWYSESMDASLFPDPAAQQEFRDFYVRKYRNRKPDVIITVGLSPLKFMQEVHRKAFPGVPVIFYLFPGNLPETLAIDSGFTGVETDMAPAETLEIALRLQPGTKHLVVINGGISDFDKQQLAYIQQQTKGFTNRLDITYMTGLTVPEMLQRLGRLPSHTLVLLSSVSPDAAGNIYRATEIGPLVASAANAPVFSLYDVFLGHGEVGGYLSNLNEEGKLVGGMALRMLRGEKPQDVPSVKGVHTYMFDWRAVKRWGLKETEIPPGSIVLNRQPTAWESYRYYIIGGISLIFVEASLIGGLLWQGARRRKVEQQLHASEDRLAGIVGSAMDAIIAVDEERRIVLFNTAAKKMFGCSQDEAVGTLIDRFIPERFRSEHGTYMRRFGESGVTTRTMGTPAALCAVRANGQEFPIEASITHLESFGRRLFTVTIRDITERRHAEEALAGVGRRLIEAQEEERSWIARELHDDVNQRIVLLSLDLERWDQQPPDSAVQFQDHIRLARQRLLDLAKDIQALSHRLHSSKLEYLGIVAAARSFCQELTDQKKVEIDFSNTNIPDGVPKEISLCIFRVLQEALQNAVKHSGVRQFAVELQGTAGGIQLTVSDLGVGFDPHAAVSGHGLGLISMRERLRLVGGQISIESQPGRGTTIHARVPFSSKNSELAAGVVDNY
jgi:PAS domain S-box-containing protein